MTSIYVLLASFNRRDKTMACIRSVLMQQISDYELKIILFDDGSTDGTNEAVKRSFPGVDLISGDGSNYWCRSMAKAHQSIANRLHDDDFIFCLNDDVELYVDSLKKLLSQYHSLNSEGSVIVGSFESSSGEPTYGGLKRLGRIKYGLEVEGGSAVDTLNFNGVLIPGSTINRNGFLDPKFEHSMGDIEYGLRLNSRNIAIVTSRSMLGLCEANELNGVFEGLNFYRRFRLCLTKKYFPPMSWLRFTRKTCGAVWPVYFFYPYLKFTIVGKK